MWSPLFLGIRVTSRLVYAIGPATGNGKLSPVDDWSVLARQVGHVQGGCDADKGGEKQGVENNGTHLISPIRCFVLTLMYACPQLQTNDINLILYIVYLNLNYEHLALPDIGCRP